MRCFSLPPASLQAGFWIDEVEHALVLDRALDAGVIHVSAHF